MAVTVYLLCSFTSFASAFLLYRGYRESRYRLLLWCAWGFLGFFLNNILLMVDMLLFPDVSISLLRTLPALVGVSIMTYGLIAEST
jgi:hypothetical protein